MLRIGKLLDAQNEKVNVKVSTMQIMHFENGKKSKTEERPELEIEIEGIVDGDSYYFDFYIQKPFEEYLSMKNYERITLDKTEITLSEDYYGKLSGKITIPARAPDGTLYTRISNMRHLVYGGVTHIYF